MNAEEIVEAVLVKYSSSDGRETCCSKADLKRDLVRIVESFIRAEKDTRQTHEAWLRVQGDIERNKSFMKRLFA